ncbi:MAG: PilX N-terminal domain-containing pilus assembly protein [Deltaproteobacteria bacterium]|jgi:type II secretory pathway component PulK|nr:PilX N-terminal domain-containing pilus assembly protein [Deltaproteobacteria bacterium]
MNALRKRIKVCEVDSQRGTAIIMAILILLVLSVIGVYAVSNSTVETKITGQERGFQEAFYTADSGDPIGVYITKRILHDDPQTVGALGTPWSSVVNGNLLGMSGRLFTNTARDPNQQPDPSTASINSAGHSVDLGLPDYVLLLVDIDRLQSQHLPGGGVEFASGYESIGQGGGGDVGVLISVDSVGRYGLRGAESRVNVGYLYVPGLAGGE